jgi:ketosteroid isomerase-like protein
MDTTTLLQAIYKAYREKRLADVLSYLSDDFRLVVHLPEDAFPGGDRPRTKAESALLFQGFLSDYDFLAYDQGPIIVMPDSATTKPQIRYRHKKTGKVLETRLNHTWWIADGKATALEERHDVPRVLAFLKSLND